jgi:FkbM family methyltransferase
MSFRDLVTLSGPLKEGDRFSGILNSSGFLSATDEGGKTLIYVGQHEPSKAFISRQASGGNWEVIFETSIPECSVNMSLSFGSDKVKVSFGDELETDVEVDPTSIRRIGGTGEWSDAKLDMIGIDDAACAVISSPDRFKELTKFKNSNFILDIGMHNGNDAAYYLAKGFRVISIDANVSLCAAAARRFKTEIDKGQMAILNVGIWENVGKLPFYVNLENSEWSSHDPKVASRGHPVKEVLVDVIRMDDLLRFVGVPYYAKIDIEGGDEWAIYPLLSRRKKPKFLSYENGSYRIFEKIAAAGYRRFQLVNQAKVKWYDDMVLDGEGKSISYSFSQGSSGPFGNDLRGDWWDAKKMAKRLKSYDVERAEQLKETLTGDWFDLHCGLGENWLSFMGR